MVYKIDCSLTPDIDGGYKNKALSVFVNSVEYEQSVSYVCYSWLVLYPADVAEINCIDGNWQPPIQFKCVISKLNM